MEMQELKKQIALDIKQIVIELNKKIKEANKLRMLVSTTQLPSRNALDSSDITVSVYEITSY